ncbi:MAG: WYL domain-containing protein [Bacteroidaceae bacterium]|nr:WYL domain-containing protein [Bacteroidaceae bacterium]
MISKTYLRYIWLLDTIKWSRIPLTFEDIVKIWETSPYAYMGRLPIRTFHEHRKGIEEMFGVIIECDKSNGYTYYVKNPEVLKQNPYAQLLLRKYSVPQNFTTFNMMRDRILLEEIPHGTAYFDPVVESMRRNTELVIDYQRYEGQRETLTMQPYSMKVYNRRWYILGYINEKEAIRHLALERILDLHTTNVKFELPKDFNPRKYYDNVVGVYVNEELPVVNLKIRVYGVQMEYMRMLPLHKSQSEVKSKYGAFAEFTYRVCLTPELKSKILALGSDVEVLEPTEYRDEIKKEISFTLNRY